MRTLTKLISKLTNPIYQKQGFVRSTIILEWKHIVGPKFAQYTRPEKIYFPLEKKTGGRLVLLTSSSFAPEIQYLEPLIINKINTYFGYRAVDKLIIRHGLITPNEQIKRKSPTLDEDALKMLQESVEEVTNTDLQEALLNLGKGIMTNPTPSPESQKEELPTKTKEQFRWDGSKF